MSVFVGGLAGTGISMVASVLTQQLWAGVNTATVNSFSHTGLTDHWTYYQQGDDGVYWKIKAFKVMNWLYCAGSAMRPEGAFFDTFYLSTYFPTIGSWAGPFDSLLPYAALTTIGIGLIMNYLVGLAIPALAVSGSLTAGIGALIIAAIILIAFIVLRIIKACKEFEQKYGESTIGDN